MKPLARPRGGGYGRFQSQERRCRDGAKGGGSALCLSHISPEGVRLIILSFFEGGTPRGGTSIRDGKEPPPGWPRAGAPYRL